jgi:hypothetical protein
LSTSGHVGEVVGDVGDVGERVVAEREPPVDEPQRLSVEQDVARVDVVVEDGESVVDGGGAHRAGPFEVREHFRSTIRLGRQRRLPRSPC